MHTKVWKFSLQNAWYNRSNSTKKTHHQLTSILLIMSSSHNDWPWMLTIYSLKPIWLLALNPHQPLHSSDYYVKDWCDTRIRQPCTWCPAQHYWIWAVLLTMLSTVKFYHKILFPLFEVHNNTRQYFGWYSSYNWFLLCSYFSIPIGSTWLDAATLNMWNSRLPTFLMVTVTMISFCWVYLSSKILNWNSIILAIKLNGWMTKKAWFQHQYAEQPTFPQIWMHYETDFHRHLGKMDWDLFLTDIKEESDYHQVSVQEVAQTCTHLAQSQWIRLYSKYFPNFSMAGSVYICTASFIWNLTQQGSTFSCNTPWCAPHLSSSFPAQRINAFGWFRHPGTMWCKQMGHWSFRHP